MKFTFSWNDNSNNETGFKVWWTGSPGGKGPEVVIGANSTSHSVNNVYFPCDHNNLYVAVWARNGSLESDDYASAQMDISGYCP